LVGWNHSGQRSCCEKRVTNIGHVRRINGHITTTLWSAFKCIYDYCRTRNDEKDLHPEIERKRDAKESSHKLIVTVISALAPRARKRKGANRRTAKKDENMTDCPRQCRPAGRVIATTHQHRQQYRPALWRKLDKSLY